MANLRSTNLNLLPILRALLAERSITGASIKLGLSQPATSHALSRLRDVFGDPLLVQLGREMHLTPRAEELRTQVNTVCTDIEQLLLDRNFDPVRIQRSFTIATQDYMALLLGPPLFRAFAQAAPSASLRFTDARPDFQQQITSGVADIAIVALINRHTGNLRIKGGYREELVGVASADHPLAKMRKVEADDLARYPRIGIAPGRHYHAGGGGGARPMTTVDGPLKLSAYHLLALPLMIAETDCIAILPRALAVRAGQMVPIASFDLPNSDSGFEMGILWSPIHDADPAHTWFVDIVDKAMRAYFTTM